MELRLIPQRGLPGAPETVVSVSGDTLIYDDTSFDLSGVPEGGEAEPSGDHPFDGVIKRIDGIIRCDVRVTLGDDALPDQPTSSEVWTVTVTEGAVAIPAVYREASPE